ncbi:MAG TPA: ATP-binding protein [Candidatus Saccharimonadales bacterium]|nr:ATP-binding protein [Candidatus Saccharimonadales bacterium]
MQSVHDRWYKIYGWLITGLSAICLCLSVLAVSISRFSYLHKSGFTALSLILAGIVLTYRLLLFGRVSREYSLRIATFAMSLLLVLIGINFINSTGQFHSWFYAGWLFLVLMGGMFGGYMILSFMVLSTMYMLLNMTQIPGQLHVDTSSLLVLAATYLSGGVAYLIWQRLYTSPESQKLAKLSGALKNQEQQAEILIESITDGLIVTDTDGKISLLNPAAATMTGWSVKEAIGIEAQLVVKLTQEDGKDIPEAEQPFRQVLRTSQQYSGTLQLVDRTNKNHCVVSLVISPVILPKGKQPVGTVAVLRDVSASREEEHRRADFISTASHEMRTPVAAIEGYLALALNDKVSKIDSKARDFLTKAHESTQRLGTLFQDLLTSAKAEDGRLVNHPVVVEMGAYLEQLAEGLRFAAEKKGLAMEFTTGTSDYTNATIGNGKVVKPLYYANIDPDRMREVITNLFDNAVKYTESGKITIGLTGNTEVVQFYIRDTGHGIPAEDLPHLFQKFYRVDNSATRTIGGTGLGLFICRKIVEMYQGRIWVESQLNHGSTFYINLPRLSSQRATELQALQPPAAGL